MRRLFEKESSIPPAARAGVLPDHVFCPFCRAEDTYCEAAFGTAHAYAQFYCRACRTPFEWIKWEEHAPSHDLPAFFK